MPFNVNGIDRGIGCILSKFVGDTKLSDAADKLSGRDDIWTDLDTLEKWADANLMKFNKAKNQILYLSWGNPQWQYRLSDELMESCTAEKDTGGWKIGCKPAKLACSPES